MGINCVLSEGGRSKSVGFTLVEVMVALAVVAIALPALLVVLSQQIEGTRFLQDQASAQWVASNRLEELRLVAAGRGRLQLGRVAGSTDMLGRTWFWWSRGEETQIPGFYRFSVSVSDDEEGERAPLHEIDGYLTYQEFNEG